MPTYAPFQLSKIMPMPPPAECPRTKKKQLHSLSGIEVDYFNLKTKRYCWPPGVNALGREMFFTGTEWFGD